MKPKFHSRCPDLDQIILRAGLPVIGDKHKYRSTPRRSGRIKSTVFLKIATILKQAGSWFEHQGLKVQAP